MHPLHAQANEQGRYLACEALLRKVVAMRRIVLLLASMALAILVATGVALAVEKPGTNQGVPLIGTAAAATTYTYTDLGTLTDVSTRPGMGNTIARGVNTRGQVVGHSLQLLEDGSVQLRAFYWDGSQMLDLGTLPPEGPTSAGPTSAARGINDKGQVVGFSRISDTSNQQQAFAAEKGADGKMQMVGLGSLAGFPSSEAWAINESGQIVGRSSVLPSSGPITSGRAFLYPKVEDGVTKMEDLGVLCDKDTCTENPDTYSEAYAINDDGKVVGASGSDENHGQAFIYSDSSTDSSMKPLGRLEGYPYGAAMGIDNHGRIVGWSYIGSRTNVQGRAFLY